MDRQEDTQTPKNELFELKKMFLNQKEKQESDEVNDLFASLAKAQEEIEVAKTSAINPFYKSKYADLASVVKASRKHLSKNNLSVIQRIITNDRGCMFLYTRLCHSSGQWIESNMPINPPKADIQSIGSYITYLKRYNYAAMVGVVTSDEDDDGEAAMKEKREVPRERSTDKITKSQLTTISKEINGNIDLINSILKGYKIEKLSDLKKKEFSKVYERIQQIKKEKENE